MPGTGQGSGWRRPASVAERSGLRARLPGGGGQCPDCRHLRLIASERTLYVRCLLAESDLSYERYPVLPVLGCPGYGAWHESE